MGFSTNSSIYNSNYNTEEPELDFTVYFTSDYKLGILTVSASVLAVLLNALLLIVTSKMKSKRQNYFSLVKSLACADLLMSLLQAVFPIKYAFDVRDNMSGLAYYIRSSVNVCFYYCFICAVALNLIMIALDNYIAIIHPLRYSTLVTGRAIHVSLTFVWLFSLLCGFSCFFTAAIQKIFYNPADDFFKLALRCSDNTRTYAIQLILLSIVQYTCVLMLLVIYTRICVEICKHQCFQREQAGMRSEDYEQGKKGVLTSFFVTGTYLLLAVPYELYVVLVISQTIEHNLMLGGILAILKCLNCICDPIIYALSLTEVRNTIKQICARSKMQNLTLSLIV